MPVIDPVKARSFAVDVVRQLRAAGFDAYWAGGCVRDGLMGREPKDFDVATNATPDQIRGVFGYRRTLAIGASFGVISVLGPRDAGQLDVATFRRDAAYSDGRHPDSVTFSSAEEDAQRRDFTVNGLFYDPLGDQVLDFVGGQEDLRNCVLRAIGDPAARFHEDKLRILRAVRFAATLGFDIEANTWQAVCQFTPQITVVSAERITEEMRRMFVHPGRPRALELLRDAGLLHQILPECIGVLPQVEPTAEATALAWDRTLRMLEHLDQPSFAVAAAVLFREPFLAQESSESLVTSIVRRWRLSNDETQAILFCLRHEELARRGPHAYWPQLQRVLTDPLAASLLPYVAAVASVVDPDFGAVEYCRECLAWPREKLDPEPLITGHDLQQLGFAPGPVFKEWLNGVRDEQLLGRLSSQEEAVEWIRRQQPPHA